MKATLSGLRLHPLFLSRKSTSQYFILKNSQTERRSGNFDNTNHSDLNTLNSVAWNEQYHVFGAWWKDENTVQLYLNGEPAGMVNTTQPFTLEQQLLWDVWTQDSPWVGGLPDKDDLLNEDNNTKYIDWVRTWQLVDE